jgi:hypothetical protein
VVAVAGGTLAGLPERNPGGMVVSAPERSRLQRLDDALVPRLQRILRPVGAVLALPARGLRRLDERVASGRLARGVTEHRAMTAFMIVAVAFGATAVHAQRYPELRQAAQQAEQQQVLPGDGTESDDDVVAPPVAGVVGPVRAARVAPYLADRRAALAALPDGGTALAVVSFAEFAGPAEVLGWLPDDVTVVAAQYRLPERDPIPNEVPVSDGDLAGSIESAVGALVTELRDEEEQVASTLESGVSDEDFRRDYEARLDELRAVRNVLSADPRILFAVVVEGPVRSLKSLAAHDAVRLVDPAPPEVEIASTEFYGVLPTDEERFSFGRPI